MGGVELEVLTFDFQPNYRYPLARVGQCLKKPRGYQGEWSPYGSSKTKTRGAAGPMGFGRGTSRGTSVTMIHQRIFHTFLFFSQAVDSPGTQLENGEGMKPYILVEVNPNAIGHDEERMHFMLFNLALDIPKVSRIR